MAKMNKNDCISYCASKIGEMWEKYGKPTDYMNRQAVYENCKTVCMNNEYTGMRFVDIWNKASKKHTANNTHKDARKRHVMGRNRSNSEITG